MKAIVFVVELFTRSGGRILHPADDLLLRAVRQHRPDFFPLLVMAVEGRELGGYNAEQLLHIPAPAPVPVSARAEAPHSAAHYRR